MNNGKHGQGTHCTKLGADSLVENTPNAQNLSAQAQKFWISMKKDFIGRCSSWFRLTKGERILCIQLVLLHKYLTAGLII